jgi:SAM-dependent methyltransferase
MSSTSVSVLLPLRARVDARIEAVVASIASYLKSTGFEFEILPLDGDDYGALLRRGVSEAKGETIVVVDEDLPYNLGAIGDAVAMIRSAATDVVFGTSSSTGRDFDGSGFAVIRRLLVSILPDPNLRLKAFSAHAARLVIGETTIAGGECDLEIAFLVNKYGFRVERLLVEASVVDATPSFAPLRSIPAAFGIRMTNRRMGYRAARRCPVCFSNDIWTWAQIPGNVVRACMRCKCRYLNQFVEVEEGAPVRRVLRGNSPPAESRHDDTISRGARDKTSARRAAALRKLLPPRARVLEVGVRDGSFGVAAARDFDYVGIDHAPAVARAARARGLDVYCATVLNFVNTGPAFDAIVLFHVIENLPDPHDALGRIKDLLKPGGMLFLTTFDTEGLLYLVTEQTRMAQNFRTHLILYSRSALIELLEHSGFEIDAIGADFEYRERRYLKHWVSSRWPRLASAANALLRLLPDPLLVSSGSIRVVAKRRAGSPLDVRAIRSAEPTHAR